jgi:hypothetical protein
MVHLLAGTPAPQEERSGGEGWGGVTCPTAATPGAWPPQEATPGVQHHKGISTATLDHSVIHTVSFPTRPEPASTAASNDNKSDANNCID